MRTLITQIKRVALALCLATPIVSWAAEKNNPVTGATETYANVFTGETAEWDSAEHWDTGARPFVSGGAYSSALVDGKAASTETSIDGWNLQVGAYNGASITWSTLGKIQGDTGMWMTVDGTSSIAINGWGGGNLGQDGKTLSYYVANKDGVIWNVDLDSGWDQGLTMNYYLAGTGSVSYQKLERAAQVIKQADVTLSGTKELTNKKLVSFTSTDKTFTADAAIKVKNGNSVLTTVYLTSVTADATTLTTEDAVGTCELVKKSDGVYLYWVDGDPADVVVDEKTYKPSININFTHGTSEILTTDADVGLSGYAVPGTSWNNFGIGQNDSSEQTFNTVKSIDSTGTASVEAGVSVNVSGHRGSYYCSSLTAASNLLQGYIDEGSSKATPTVTITGIPYEHYRVIVYHSTDTANVPFGYDTINGFNFTYVNGVQTTGTDSWGASGADQSAGPIEEGVNTLVSAVLSGDTVTMIAHRIGGDYPSARGCFAAIQVVEYVPEVSENDLEIEVDGDIDYPVDADKTLSGTVYLTGSGTLTLSGDYKITAATIDVAKDVVLNINADRLDATTFTGSGTVVYDGTAPVEGKGWANIGWSGTVWIKNQAVAKFDGTKYGNAGSTIRFTGVTGYMETVTNNNTGKSTSCEQTVPFELVDDGDTLAFTYNNGWGGNLVKINTLKGTGTLKTQTAGLGEHIYIVDGSGFTGVFNLTGKYVYVGGSQPDNLSLTNPGGKLEIRSGVTMTVPSGKTWTANGGFVVDGTLNATGTLASTHETKAVSGSGMVVFGGVPSPTGDAWWKNAAWTGTVQVNGYTSMAGNIPFNDCGNAESIVELKNVTGWINYSYTCTPKLKVTGTLYLNNGSSGKGYAFKVGTLLGDGAISGDGSASTVVFNVTTDWSGFTGTIGLNNKCVVFGSTIPDSLTAGTIYVSEGAVVTPQQSSGVWWAVNGIKVDGELCAPNLSKFDDATGITTGDNGVFTLTSTANVNDANYGNGATSADLSRITGTGTLKYSSTAGWRAFPTADDHMPASTLTLQMELADSLIISKNNGETVVGSLAGSKNIRSDFGTNGAEGRILTVTQSKDTEWEGKFVENRLTQFNVVAPTEGTPGTLTLSGTQEATIPMQVDGSVNLTGTWVGATTVAGTFGGTGTITSNLTFDVGSTFKAFSSDEDGLTVSGTITYPDEGTVTVDVSAIDGASVIKLISASGLDANKFTLTEAAVENGYELKVVDDKLTLTRNVASVYFEYEAETRYYTTMAAAIADAKPTGKVITLLANFEEAYVLESGRIKVASGEYTWTGLTAPEGYKIVATPGAGYTQYAVAEDLPVVARIGTVEGQYEYSTVDAALQAAYPMPVGTVVYVLVPVADWKYSTDMPATYKPHYNWDGGTRTLTRKATTNGEGEQTVTATSEQDACNAVIVLPTNSDVETALDGYSYSTYFQKTAKDNGDGTWTVTVELSKAKVFVNDVVQGDASETTTVTATLNGVLDDTVDEITIPAKRGLYYSFKSGNEVTGMTEGERKLATTNSVTLDKVDGDTFYQVLVNTTPKAAAAND